MFLGISAALSGIIYAFVKFLTMARVKRLRGQVTIYQNEVQRSKQRAKAMEERLQFERNRKRVLERTTRDARETTEKIYNELRKSLPKSLSGDLEECFNLARASELEERRMLHDLKFSDKIADSLETHSLLLFEFLSDEESYLAMLVNIFSEIMDCKGVNYSNANTTMLLCSFDSPQEAIELIREYLQQIPNTRFDQLRASLSAGVDVEDECTDITQLFASALQNNRNLLKRTPHGTLIMNGSAYENLESNKENAMELEKDEQLYVLDLKDSFAANKSD